MSSYQFPWWLPGIAWPVLKKPVYATHVQQALSGKESRIAYKQYPQFDFSLTLSVARDDVVRTQLLASTEDWSQSVWTTTNTLIVGAPFGLSSLSPFGSLEADYILELPNSGNHYSSQLNVALAAGSYTLSVFAKSSTRNLALEVSDGTNSATGGFNLSTGAAAVTSVTGTVTNASVSVLPSGVSGWYRCALTFTVAAGTYGMFISPCTLLGVTNYTGDGVSGVYVWGAQLEPGGLTGYMPNTGLSAPQTYSERWALYGLFNAMQGQYDTFLYEDPTFNSVLGETFATGNGAQTVFQLQARDINGLGVGAGASPTVYEITQAINGAPVIYSTPTSGVGTSQLLPAAREQYLKQSQTLATSPWATAAATATNAAGTAPDGTATACTLIPTTASAQHTDTQGSIAGIPAGAFVIFSVYAKPDGYNFLALTVSDGGADSVSQVFNLSTGVLGASSSAGGTYLPVPFLHSVQAVGGGFYRCAIGVWCATNAPTTVVVGVQSSDSLANFAGNGTSGLLLWGAQLETVVTSGAATSGVMPIAPTSYLPSTSSQVVAGADLTVVNGSVTVGAAPAGGTQLSWNGCFFYRCRFVTDELEFSEMLKRWWEVKTIEFLSVKL